MSSCQNPGQKVHDDYRPEDRHKNLTPLNPLLTSKQHTLRSMTPWYTKPKLLIGAANLFATAGATYYLKSKIDYSLEENEARADEIEGTLRGHIGLIHEAHDRIEAKIGSAGRGKGGLENREMYDQRGRDDKKKEQ